jgi:hypothetical protein
VVVELMVDQVDVQTIVQPLMAAQHIVELDLVEEEQLELEEHKVPVELKAQILFLKEQMDPIFKEALVQQVEVADIMEEEAVDMTMQQEDLVLAVDPPIQQMQLSNLVQEVILQIY